MGFAKARGITVACCLLMAAFLFGAVALRGAAFAAVADAGDALLAGQFAGGDEASQDEEPPLALTTQEGRPAVTLSANVHVQNKGWTGKTSIGGKTTQIGTTGSGLRLEALRFDVAGAEGTIQCQVHVQNIGWQDVRSAGSIAGTTGQGLRIEAIRLALTGELSQWYDLTYQAHVQDIGWMDWVSDGAVAGTSGRALRLEALNVKLTPKSAKSSQAGDGIIDVRASAHVQNIGWQGEVNAGATIGTTGQGLRVEAMKLTLDSGALGGTLQANAHVQDIGWQGYRTGTIGTTGQSLRMEAVQLKLTGEIAGKYDVVYRAHVQNIGWQPWVANGATAGTQGLSLRVEALQVKLVKKGSKQAVGEGAYFVTAASDAGTALASSGGSGAQAASEAFSAGSASQRYYVRNENGGITLQSVATGMFLEESGGKVVQKAYDASNSSQVWALAWDGGYVVKNKASGKQLSLSGGKAVTGGSQGWMFTGASLIADGDYVVKNAAAGKVLDVSGASWSAGANIMVHDANGGGNQAFTFENTGSDVYKVTCALTFKAVEVANASTEDGANVRQWGVNGSDAQLWRASIDHSGRLSFKNRASGKLLTASGSGASNANVVSSANTGASTQKWTLSPSAYQPDEVLQRAMDVADGAESDTSYFIAVDLTNNRTVVFEGEKGAWTPIQNWVVSTGAPTSPTVLGDYTIDSRGYSFGSGYTCYYWTQFYGDYLFHSILYDEGTFDVQDGRLGYSISQGCVRMDIDDAKWIHDNIPSGTHVKTYY